MRARRGAARAEAPLLLLTYNGTGSVRKGLDREHNAQTDATAREAIGATYASM